MRFPVASLLFSCLALTQCGTPAAPSPSPTDAGGQVDGSVQPPPPPIDDGGTVDRDAQPAPAQEYGSFLGLHNFGSTCYANSAMQLLFGLDDILAITQKALTKEGFDSDADLAKKQGIQKALHALMQGLTDNRTAVVQADKAGTFTPKAAPDSFRPQLDALYMAIGTDWFEDRKTNAKIGVVGQQQDSQEYLGKLLDVLQFPKGVSMCKELYKKNDGSFLKISGEESLHFLPLHLKPTVQAALDGFLEEENLEPTNEAKGQDKSGTEHSVNKIRPFLTQSAGRKLKHLILQLKRFQYDLTGGATKIDLPVVVSDILNVPLWNVTTEFALPTKAETKRMTLRAAVIQTGSLEGGHYRAYRKDEALGGWLHLNDSSVTKVTWAEAEKDITANGYLFLYEVAK